MTKTDLIKQVGSIRNQLGQKSKQVQSTGTSQQDVLIFINQIDNRLNLIMRELSIEIYREEQNARLQNQNGPQCTKTLQICSGEE